MPDAKLATLRDSASQGLRDAIDDLRDHILRVAVDPLRPDQLRRSRQLLLRRTEALAFALAEEMTS